MTRGCRTLLCVLACAAASGCGQGGDAGEAADEDPQSVAISRGKHYYDSVCIACHSGNPSVEGTLGPALAGVPLAVIEAKVMRGEYPPGYTPRRDTSTMPSFQYLEPELANIAAYLTSIPSER